jgi:DNA-binding beta-propeller fold protein YncE
MVQRTAVSTDPAIGTEIAGYRIEGVIGRGGMSVVYLAEDLSLGRLVALKLLAPELVADERFRERFVRESRLAAALEHPNIIPIFEAKEAQGRLYIAMRYVQGTDLKGLIEREGRLTASRALAILSQVAGALDAAHERGLVHRDVKPGNILIARGSGSRGDEHVYLSDFGLTKRALSDSGVTATGQFVGTFDYAAPEQFEGKPLDARTDVYSLGCVLYQSLTGELPFPRDQEAAAMYAHLMTPPPKVTDIRPELPGAIDGVVAKAMAKSPDDRYPTAGDLIRGAREALQEPRVDGTLPPAPAEGSLEEPSESGPEGLLSWAKRRPVSVVVGLVLLGAVIATLAALLPGAGTPKTASRGGPTTAADRLERFDPGNGSRVGRIEAGHNPREIAIGSGGVWVKDDAGPDRSEISKIDPHSGRLVKRIRLGFGVDDLAVGGIAGQEALWVTDGGRYVYRLDPDSGKQVAKLDMGQASEGRDAGPGAIAIEEDAVWVCLFDAGKVARIDPNTNEVVSVIDVGSQPNNIAAGGGSVWATNFIDATVSRIDPARNAVVQTIDVGNQPTDIAVGAGGVWVVNLLDGSISRIDPATGTISDTIKSGGRRPLSIALGPGANWVSDYDNNTISIFIPSTRSLAKSFPAAKVGETITDVAFGYGSFWLTIDAPG